MAEEVKFTEDEMKQIKEFFSNLFVILIISATISFLVYLWLMPESKKPKTYKQITLDHFLNIHKDRGYKK